MVNIMDNLELKGIYFKTFGFKSKINTNHVALNTRAYLGRGSFWFKPQNEFVGRGWRIGGVDAFRPKGHACFDSRPSHHVVNFGKSFIHSCLLRFGVKFWHSIRAVSGAPLSSSGLEKAL